MHGVVPSTLVGLLYDYLADRDLPAVEILGEPRPDTGEHGLGRFPARRWQQLLERAGDYLHDPRLGLHLGQTVTAAHFGVMGYVFHNCADLGAAFERYRRFERLVYDMEPVRFGLDADTLVLEWGVGHGRPGRLVDETAITAMLQLARSLTGERIAPDSVHFVNPEPAKSAPYRAYFGCPVYFDQPHTIVRVPRSVLTLPLQQADPALLRLLETQAESMLARLPADESLEEAVRRSVVRAAPAGVSGLAAIAADLGLSTRTLHRRLAARGATFRVLRDDALRQVAERHLADPRLTLADIALLLGYSEQSAFTRAFRRWTAGKNPDRYRRDIGII